MSKKEAYVEKMQAQLDQWKAEIDKLKAKADEAQADLRVGYYRQIDGLKARQKEAQKILEDLSQAGDNAWETLKAGVDHSLKEVGSAVKSTVERFRS